MKRVFSWNLFLEGIKQLKIAGVVGMVISTLISFFIINRINIQTITQYTNSCVQPPEWSYIGFGECLSMKLLAWIFVPLAMLVLFGFLNNKSASDFYFTLHQRREALCISFLMAVFVWTIVTMVTALLGVVVITTILPHVRLARDFWQNIVAYGLEAVVSAVFLMGVMLIAMSLTGNIASNIGVALMIMIVPKLVYLVFMDLGTEGIYIYPYPGDVFEGEYNLVTRFVNIGYGYDCSFFEDIVWESIVYTAVVGMLACALGVVAFCIRKPETASKPAATEKIGFIFQLLPPFVITIMPCTYIYYIFVEKHTLYAADAFWQIVFYGIAAVVYLFYTFITTRKLTKIFRGFVAVLCMDAVFLGAIWLRRQIVFLEVPKNSDSVRILDAANISSNAYNFFEEHGNDIVITDSKVIEILEENLVQNIKVERKGKIPFDDQMQGAIWKGRWLFEVVFEKDGRRIWRNVYVNNEEIPYITQALMDSEYMELLTNLHRLDVENIIFCDIKMPDNSIFEEYAKEIRKAPERYINFILYQNENDVQFFGNLRATVKERNQFMYLPVFYFTDLADLYFRYYKEQYTQKQPLVEFVRDMGNENTDKDRLFTEFTLYMPVYDEDGNMVSYEKERETIRLGRTLYEDEENKKRIAEVIKYLTSVQNEPLYSEHGFVHVVYEDNRSSNGNLLYGGYYPLTEEGVQLFTSLRREYK